MYEVSDRVTAFKALSASSAPRKRARSEEQVVLPPPDNGKKLKLVVDKVEIRLKILDVRRPALAASSACSLPFSVERHTMYQ